MLFCLVVDKKTPANVRQMTVALCGGVIRQDTAKRIETTLKKRIFPKIASEGSDIIVTQKNK